MFVVDLALKLSDLTFHMGVEGWSIKRDILNELDLRDLRKSLIFFPLLFQFVHEDDCFIDHLLVFFFLLSQIRNRLNFRFALEALNSQLWLLIQFQLWLWRVRVSLRNLRKTIRDNRLTSVYVFNEGGFRSDVNDLPRSRNVCSKTSLRLISKLFLKPVCFEPILTRLMLLVEEMNANFLLNGIELISHWRDSHKFLFNCRVVTLW